MSQLSPEFLLLVKHLRIKLIDLRDLAVDQMGQDLLDAIERVIDHAVEDDNHSGLLIASDRNGDTGTIAARTLRFD